MKDFARRALTVASYWMGIDALFYWLNRRAKRVIPFHNVLPDEVFALADPIGCMMRLCEFEKIIGELSKRFHFSTDLSDPSTITLTFDDGLLSEYVVAGECLRRRGIPAILFVAGDAIDATPERTLITDRILVWCMLAPDAAVRSVFGVVLPRAELWVRYVQPGYRADGAHRGRAFLAKLEAVCTVKSLLQTLPSEWVRLRLSGCTAAQLEDLRGRGWEIGWHTQSHFPLGFLDDEATRLELACPPEYRSVVLGYPYGRGEEVGESTMRIAEDLGYPCAVSDDPDPSPLRGRYYGLRLSVSSDRYELHFVLSGFKYFLKCRRLLPTMSPLV